MNEKIYATVDSVESLNDAFAVTREAQKKFATYTQEQVDKIKILWYTTIRGIPYIFDRR